VKYSPALRATRDDQFKVLPELLLGFEKSAFNTGLRRCRTSGISFQEPLVFKKLFQAI